VRKLLACKVNRLKKIAIVEVVATVLAISSKRAILVVIAILKLKKVL